MKHKAFSLLVLLALLLGLAACSGEATSTPAPTDPMQTFEQEVERLRKELRIPGMSVAVIQEQEVIFARGFGYADLENQIPATEDTPYNIASCPTTVNPCLTGWFVQEAKGTKLIWHYGYAPGAYSSLILKVLEEEVTLIFLANSDGASAGFYLGDGDVLRSPFAVTFLNLITDLEVE